MRHFLNIIFLAIFFMAFISMPYADELTSGYISVSDESGNIIFETGRFVEMGDQFISEDNHLYEIISISENEAKARILQKIQPKTLSSPSLSVPGSPSAAFKPYIAIYHTHTDESYIPTDGQSVRAGNGSIIRVGGVLADSLRTHGYEVVHSSALHDPHDANAYQRSRRTAANLMKKNYPAAMFDVHRDSVPLKNYHVIINGKEAAKILLVVGRQSQNRPLIQNFAGNIKAVADNMHPGLIRGIFIARGDYNQDLTPRNILLEMGTQYNSLEAAQRSAVLIADVIPPALSLTNQGANMFNFAAVTKTLETSSSQNQWTTSVGTIEHPLWKILLVVTVVGVAAYFGLKKYLPHLLRRN